jgi:hypothetical protein
MFGLLLVATPNTRTPPDLQVLMAVFMYVYYWTFISKPELSVGDVLSTAMKLGDLQQVGGAASGVGHWSCCCRVILGHLHSSSFFVSAAQLPCLGFWSFLELLIAVVTNFCCCVLLLRWSCLQSWATCWWGRGYCQVGCCKGVLYGQVSQLQMCLFHMLLHMLLIIEHTPHLYHQHHE